MWYWPFAAPNRTLILPWQLCGGLLEGKDGLFFSEFPTLCPQYYFNTHWSWSLAPLTTSSRSVTLPSLMKRPTGLQPLVWVIYPKRELPILIDGLFCLPWKRNRRKKVFSDFSFFWRVSNNFLLCWKARLPLSTGYWIYSLPGWWNSRNFGKGSHANCLFTSIVIWLQSWAGFVFSQVTSEQLVTELNLQNGRRKLPKTELCRQCPRAVPALPLSARPLERLSVGSSTLPSERAPTKAIGAASALAGSIQIIWACHSLSFWYSRVNSSHANVPRVISYLDHFIEDEGCLFPKGRDTGVQNCILCCAEMKY